MITPVSKTYETESTFLEDQKIIYLSFASLSPCNKAVSQIRDNKEILYLTRVWRGTKCLILDRNPMALLGVSVIESIWFFQDIVIYQFISGASSKNNC